MSVVPEPTGGNSVVQIDNVPPKSNYVAPNAAGMAGASAKIKIGGAVFALILTAAGITGGVVSTGGGVTNTTTTQAVVSSTAEPGTNAATTIR